MTKRVRTDELGETEVIDVHLHRGGGNEPGSSRTLADLVEGYSLAHMG